MNPRSKYLCGCHELKLANTKLVLLQNLLLYKQPRKTMYTTSAYQESPTSFAEYIT